MKRLRVICYLFVLLLALPVLGAVGSSPASTAWAAAGTITEYPVPTTNSVPVDIPRGPDGALWFSEFFGNKIGRITPV